MKNCGRWGRLGDLSWGGGEAVRVFEGRGEPMSEWKQLAFRC